MRSEQTQQKLPTQQKQGRRPTQRSERTRLEVLEAAALCIAEEGFAAASTVLIAEKAEVSWGVLQYHFGDKESLMSAVLEYSMQQTERRFKHFIEQGISADTMTGRLHILVDEAWEIYASPLARAATEIVINNRSNWQRNSAKEQYLLELNKRQLKLAKRAMYIALNDKKTANLLASLFLATLTGFEAGLLQYGRGYNFKKEREALVLVMSHYASQQTT